MNTTKNEVGQRMQIYRKSTDKTTAEFAKILGLKERTLGSYERGQNAPSLDLIINFVKKFDVSLDWLLLGIGTPGRVDDVIEDFKVKYSVSDKKISALSEILKTPEMLNALFLFIQTLKGDKNALKILSMLNENPELLKTMYEED